jgi:hypothetical protein
MSTSQGTGDMSLSTYTFRFETLVELKALKDTLPYSVLPAENVAWLSQGDLPAGVIDCKGYEFANGDMVVLFTTSTLPGDGTLFEAQARTLLELARAEYPNKSVWADPSFDYVVAAHDEDYMRALMSLAEQARAGRPELVPW